MDRFELLNKLSSDYQKEIKTIADLGGYGIDLCKGEILMNLNDNMSYDDAKKMFVRFYEKIKKENGY